MEEKKPIPVQRVEKFWKGLNKTVRIAMVAVLGVLLVLIVYLISTVGRVEYEVLQTGLTPQEAAEATTILGDLNLPYTVEGVSSITIQIPKGTRSQVLLQLQNEGFPTSDADSYKFYTENASGMGVTDEDKRVYDRFATEQRLAYLIKQMDKVKDAGVMVTLAQTSQFAISASNQPAQASVVLTLEPGVTLSDAEAEAIRSLVVTAVAGLKPENVTITDTNMHVYEIFDADGSGNVYVADQIALKQQHQELIQQQVYNFLNPVFGVGNVVVSASVNLDFDKKSTQTVKYSPPGDEANMGIIVSLQQAAERAGVTGTDMAQGAAGFDANGAAPFYPEDLSGDSAPTYSYSQQLNAEVNEVREQIEEAQGKVTGLSVSIMIDGDDGLDEELENIRALVANGLGVDEQYISIMRTSFKSNEDYEKMQEEQTAADAARADANGQVEQQTIILAASAVALVIVVVLILLAMRSRRRRKAHEEEMLRLAETREAETERLQEQETVLRERIGDLDDSAAITRLKDIQQLTSERPDVVAQLLRNWLTDDYR